MARSKNSLLSVKGKKSKQGSKGSVGSQVVGCQTPVEEEKEKVPLNCVLLIPSYDKHPDTSLEN